MEIPLSGKMPHGLPHAPLDRTIPGMDVLQKVFLKLGLDPSILMSIGMMITVMMSLGGFLNYAWLGMCRFWSVITDNLVSQATIHSSDQTFLYLMKWLASNEISTDCRVFCVTSKKNPQSAKVKRYSYFNESRRAPEEDDEEEEDELGPKLKYSPAPGFLFFFYKGHLVWVKRQVDTSFFYGDNPDETLLLTTVGRSPHLLRTLLDEARTHYLTSEKKKTTVFSITSHGHHQKNWDQGRSRPSRAMSTVIMQDKDKDFILRDTREYLRSETAIWYAERGLPYRRGYLFYGPPGTGKTSLTLALAGELKLPLYIFSLSAGGDLNDETLAYLFQMLPRRCIVLLEDIDCAGLSRSETADISADTSSDEDEAPLARSSKSQNNKPQSTKAGNKALRTSDARGIDPRTSVPNSSATNSVPFPHRQRNQVSFSGLLNAIDGVASHEGRILIMTTNHKERLDPALIRPGRVDVQIEFGYALRETSRRVFMEIYQGSNRRNAPPIPPPTMPIGGMLMKDDDYLFQPSPVQEKGPLSLSTDFNTPPATPSSPCTPSMDLPSMAELFANAIPSGRFTPAELQGYLIMHKNDPLAALRGINSWVEDKMVEKEKRERRKNRQRMSSMADAKKVGTKVLRKPESESVVTDVDAGSEEEEVVGGNEHSEGSNSSGEATDGDDDESIDTDSTKNKVRSSTNSVPAPVSIKPQKPTLACLSCNVNVGNFTSPILNGVKEQVVTDGLKKVGPVNGTTNKNVKAGGKKKTKRHPNGHANSNGKTTNGVCQSA